ncbi:MAG TPA: MFS transporter, partial [Gammaproteobacteria bacterium]|nr:MFS transporter [Gammaproteobacteria bacterium]
DQLGRKRVALAAIGIAAVATLVFLLATGIAWLFVGRALSGLAIGITAGTATAWIADVRGQSSAHRSAVDATVANFCGLALGALVAGALAQYAPAPLRLCYVVYLVVLAILALFVARAGGAGPPTVQGPLGASLRLRIGVPRGLRAAFFPPAANAFATFALLGFYAALTPTVLRDLGVANVAAGGAIVALLCAIAAAAVYATSAMGGRRAMRIGLWLLVPSVALLAASHLLGSLPLFLLVSAITGVATALGYRGSLQSVTEIAPPARRAELLSSYQIACFGGNALPVIGVGLLSSRLGAKTATLGLALLVGALAVAALAMDVARNRAGAGYSTV